MDGKWSVKLHRIKYLPDLLQSTSNARYDLFKYLFYVHLIELIDINDQYFSSSYNMIPGNETSSQLHQHVMRWSIWKSVYCDIFLKHTIFWLQVDQIIELWCFICCHYYIFISKYNFFTSCGWNLMNSSYLFTSYYICKHACQDLILVRMLVSGNKRAYLWNYLVKYVIMFLSKITNVCLNLLFGWGM